MDDVGAHRGVGDALTAVERLARVVAPLAGLVVGITAGGGAEPPEDDLPAGRTAGDRRQHVRLELRRVDLLRRRPVLAAVGGGEQPQVGVRLIGLRLPARHHVELTAAVDRLGLEDLGQVGARIAVDRVVLELRGAAAAALGHGHEQVVEARADHMFVPLPVSV